PSRMPQTPAAILFSARGLWLTAGSATPQLTQTTAGGAVGLPQCQQYETPARGLAPHLVQATARSSSCVPQFRQNIIYLVGWFYITPLTFRAVARDWRAKISRLWPARSASCLGRDRNNQ